MDAFDQYLFNELTKSYAPKVLTRDELESIYIRMRNLEDLEEVQPYLYAMRYFGWGTPAEPEAVLAELKDATVETQPILAGLYQDLILSTGKGNDLNKRTLDAAKKKGYSWVYLKQKSALAPVEKKTPAKDLKAPEPKLGNGLNITRVALFNSTRNKARPEDTTRYETSFKSSTLDALYIKTIFQAPGKPLQLKYRIKIDNLTTNKLFYESTGTAELTSQSTAHWIGVFVNGGKWPTGRYRYTWELGGIQKQLLFTVS